MMRIEFVLLMVVLVTLAGCVTRTPSVKTVVIRPDATLLEDCPVPQPERSPSGDILIGGAVSWSAELLGALLSCNQDKAAMRQFYKEAGDGSQARQH